MGDDVFSLLVRRFSELDPAAVDLEALLQMMLDLMFLDHALSSGGQQGGVRELPGRGKRKQAAEGPDLGAAYNSIANAMIKVGIR